MEAYGNGQEKEQKDGERLIFALDIGTRSVIGVVGRVENDILRILKVESEEHTERAVVDGQIENIEQTARVAGRVKKRLESYLGLELKEVYVAAAGRVLKTKRASCEMELDDKTLIEQRQLSALEAKAIQQAYEDLMTETEESGNQAFYCVGRSVIRYTLDGYQFSTLLNHRGRRAKVELIGTFLPSEVVESLYTTMSRVGLTILGVTLEPIAAINAVIPQELRLLNVALVDVGAGTSDIAIANEGSVCAYTMATIAGDEITECAMREFLVDFRTAEQIKQMVSEGRQNIPYTDILGLEYDVSQEEVREKLQPAVELLAQTIGQRILEINGDPPMAVFMVGGGSRTPGLCELVAKNLNIDEKKVAIGGNNYMKRMVDTEQQYISAEYATPIGIAISAISSQGQENMTVTVNGERVQMLNGGIVTLIEALLRGGYQYNQIIGRSGQSVTFELNGEKKTVRGGLPGIAEFTVNGHSASITSPLQAGDEILFTPATNGQNAQPLLKEVVEGWTSFSVNLAGVDRRVGVTAFLNGAAADGEERIRQDDKIEVRWIRTLGELLEEEGITSEILDTHAVVVNGEPCEGLDYLLKDGDAVFPAEGLFPEPPSQESLDSPPPPEQEEKPEEEKRTEGNSQGVRILLNGSECVIPQKENGVVQFFDVLNYVDIDPSNPQGEIAVLRNGRTASYIEPIQDGDRIEVFWKNNGNVTKS